MDWGGLLRAARTTIRRGCSVWTAEQGAAPGRLDAADGRSDGDWSTTSGARDSSAATGTPPVDLSRREGSRPGLDRACPAPAAAAAAPPPPPLGRAPTPPHDRTPLLAVLPRRRRAPLAGPRDLSVAPRRGLGCGRRPAGIAHRPQRRGELRLARNRAGTLRPWPTPSDEPSSPQRARRATRLVVIWNNQPAGLGSRVTGRAFFGHVSCEKPVHSPRVIGVKRYLAVSYGVQSGIQRFFTSPSFVFKQPRSCREAIRVRRRPRSAGATT